MEGLWYSQGQDYETWICRLTFALANQAVRDRVFKLCAPMCLRKAEFAEFIFPYVVLHSVFYPPSALPTQSSAENSDVASLGSTFFIYLFILLDDF